MASLFSNYMTDRDIEKNGTWVEFDSMVNDDGTIPTFLIARATSENRQYANRTLALRRKYNSNNRNIEDLSGNELINYSKDTIAVFCDIILLDWRNVKYDAKLDDEGKMISDKNGVPICEEMVYNKQNANQLLFDIPSLFFWLTTEASNYQNFLAKKREEDLKN